MPATSYTRATLRAAVLAELSDESGVYFTPTRVNAEIDNACVQFLQDSRMRRATTTINVLAGQAEYSLVSVTPRVLDVLRVALPGSENDTDERDLTFTTQEDIERHDANWRQTEGQPYAYMRWGQGFSKIRLYPEPTSSYTAIADADAATFSGLYGGIINVTGLTDTAFDALYGGVIGAAYKYGAMRVDYIAGATALTQDSDSIETTNEIPPEHQDALLWWVCWRLLESDTPLQQIEKSQLYLGKYQTAVAQAKALVEGVFQTKPTRSSYTEWF